MTQLPHFCPRYDSRQLPAPTGSAIRVNPTGFCALNEPSSTKEGIESVYCPIYIEVACWENCDPRQMRGRGDFDNTWIFEKR